MNRFLVWRCIHCTYDNDPSTSVCAACSRTRQESHSNGSGTADAARKQQQKRMRSRKLEIPSCSRKMELKSCPRSDSDTSLSSGGSSLGSQTSLSCSSSWLCSKCLRENPLINKVCVSCSTERKYHSHFPHNLLNNKDYKHSSKEDYKKNCQFKPLPPLLVPGSSWNCLSCYHGNSLVFAHCSECGTPAQTTVQTTSTQNGDCKSYSRKNKNKVAPSSNNAPPSPLSKNFNHLSLPKQLIPDTKETKPELNGYQDYVRKPEVLLQDDTTESYKEIVKYFRNLRTNFVDDSFRPCDKSVYGDEDRCNGESRDTMSRDTLSRDTVTWLRPPQIDCGNSTVKWTLFRTPLPTDIIQGSLGDCWLLSSLSVLADKPSLIEKIFLNKHVSTEGVYQVRLCKDGQWTEVIVDDYFPCYSNKKLMFAQSDRKQLWVPVIEKAVAKLYGGYQNLRAGHCSEGLQLLTGAPVEFLKLSDYQEDLDLFWGMLLSYQEAGYPMGVCCTGEGQQDQAICLGLTTGHAYSLLNLHSSQNVRLIQLRNPWAKDTWTGPYNNKCSSWTEELRAQLMVFEDSSEAVFWIELRDFTRYFTTLDVCRLHPTWREWRGSGRFSPTSPTVVYLSVGETSTVDLSLVQVSRRGNVGACSVDIGVAILRCDNDTSPQSLVEYSGRTLLNNITCTTLITPGTYMILPMSFLAEDRDQVTYSLACFVDKECCVWQDEGDSELLPHVLYKVTLARGIHRDALEGCSVYQLNKRVAGLVMVVENRNSHRWFRISCDSHNTSNVVSTRGQITTCDWVPPLSRMVIMILTQLDETCGFKIQSSYKFSLVSEGPASPRESHEPEIQSSIHKTFPL